MNAPETSDSELLLAWAVRGDRDAAGELVRRHIGFVHAVANRRVGGDTHLADDITQAVFILLLQKSPKTPSEAAMATWLYTTTQYAAANAVKMLRRREFHEQQVPPASGDEQPARGAENAELNLLLHDAIDQLPRTDRLCVILGCLQEKTHSQVGAALGLSQDAARKRTARAIERLREYLGAHGVIVPSAAVIAAMSVKETAVSTALIQSTLNVAILSQAANTTAASVIAKGVSHMIMTMKLKLAAMILIAFTITGFVTAQVVKSLGFTAPVTPVMMDNTAPATQPDDAGAANGIADLGDGVVVEFVGVAPFQGDQWHNISGAPMDAPPDLPPNRSHIVPPPRFQVYLRITRPADAGQKVEVLGSTGSGMSSTSLQGDALIAFDMPAAATSADIQVSIADGPWKNLMQPRIRPGAGVMGMSTPKMDITLTPPIEKNNGSLVYFTCSQTDGPTRLCCIDSQGQEHVGKPQGSSGGVKFETTGYFFDVLPAQIKTLEIQSRPFNKTVIAKGVCLDPANPTTPQLLIGPQ